MPINVIILQQQKTLQIQVVVIIIAVTINFKTSVESLSDTASL